MSDDPLMAMHEAQAIAIEKQLEIDRLKSEKEELEEKLNGNEDKLEKKFSKLCKYLGLPLILGCLIICAVVFLIIWTAVDNTTETAVDNTTKRKSTSETILIMGGAKNHSTFAGMAVLSQDRTKWIEIELGLPYKTSSRGAIYLNGEIYLFGGFRNPKALYNLGKNLKWIRLADMNVGRRRIENSCLEWNGYIWVFGGYDENKGYLKSVERYDPKENKWTLMADMKEARSHAAAAVWNNKIIICGGWIEQSTITNSAECYNPEDNSWIEFPTSPKPLGGHSLVTYENKLILFGGWSGGATNTVWELDPQESNPSWSPLPPMKYPSAYFAGIILNQEIYAIGGEQKEYFYQSRVEIFDGKRWRDGAALPYTWAEMSSVIIPQTLADRLCQYKKE